MSAGMRVLVIVYGLAMVLLGARSLEHRYGGVMASLSSYTQKLAGKSLDLSGIKLPTELSVSVGDPDGREGAERGETLQLERGRKPVEAFDHIRDTDRRELNRLLEALGDS